MPELPDITVYQEAIDRHLCGETLRELKINNPFLLRTIQPAADQFANAKYLGCERIGKRIALQFSPDLWAVIHLMIAGRLHWQAIQKKPARKKALLQLVFDNGSLLLTEAGSKRRAALHLFCSHEDTQILNRGGLEIAELDVAGFHKRLVENNHTLKRALTDPKIFSGIGNAYSDEILHRARLSPVRQTQKLTQQEIEQLFSACRHVLSEWTERLRDECGEAFPKTVTAFREGMAVHGRYREACPDCGTRVQRIRYSSNETNYCPRCQSDGKLLADRSLSRLLKKDWPKTIEELEEKTGE